MHARYVLPLKHATRRTGTHVLRTPKPAAGMCQLSACTPGTYYVPLKSTLPAAQTPTYNVPLQHAARRTGTHVLSTPKPARCWNVSAVSMHARYVLRTAQEHRSSTLPAEEARTYCVRLSPLLECVSCQRARQVRTTYRSRAPLQHAARRRGTHDG
jgi:hypothetical protein